MATLKIVPSALTPAGEEIAALLARLLRDAEEGRISGLAVAVVRDSGAGDGGTLSTVSVVAVDPAAALDRLLGQMTYLQSTVVNLLDEVAHDARRRP